jgi:Spy/CpxP family protein refolding chaperone
VQQSKNVAMAFLLGTFLTGGVLGFSANRFMHRDEVCTTKGVDPVLERMTRRLDLTAEQSARIEAILDNRSTQFRRVMAPLRPQFDSIKANAREQMRQVLDQEQKLEFEALIREMNDSTRKDDDQE